MLLTCCCLFLRAFCIFKPWEEGRRDLLCLCLTQFILPSNTLPLILLLYIPVSLYRHFFYSTFNLSSFSACLFSVFHFGSDRRVCAFICLPALPHPTWQLPYSLALLFLLISFLCNLLPPLCNMHGACYYCERQIVHSFFHTWFLAAENTLCISGVPYVLCPKRQDSVSRHSMLRESRETSPSIYFTCMGIFIWILLYVAWGWKEGRTHLFARPPPGDRTRTGDRQTGISIWTLYTQFFHFIPHRFRTMWRCCWHYSVAFLCVVVRLAFGQKTCLRSYLLPSVLLDTSSNLLSTHLSPCCLPFSSTTLLLPRSPVLSLLLGSYHPYKHILNGVIFMVDWITDRLSACKVNSTPSAHPKAGHHGRWNVLLCVQWTNMVGTSLL